MLKMKTKIHAQVHLPKLDTNCAAHTVNHPKLPKTAKVTDIKNMER